MADIYRIYQGSLDQEDLAAVLDSQGNISREDFVKLASDDKLVDFNDRKHKDDTPEKTPVKKVQPQYKGGVFCCCKRAVSPEKEVDRIELAFRRIDLNNDGYITWDEFKRVSRVTLRI